MEKKLFQLPKEFATRWLAALRSGKYKQAKGALLLKDAEGNKSYCCLGVACDIQGIEEELLLQRGFPDDIKLPIIQLAIPEQLMRSWDNPLKRYTLASVLSSLNDGESSKLTIGSEEVINEEHKMHTFAEIADWIEEHVEFVEGEEPIIGEAPEPKEPELEYPQ
jgi:hypothetical protein